MKLKCVVNYKIYCYANTLKRMTTLRDVKFLPINTIHNIFLNDNIIHNQ